MNRIIAALLIGLLTASGAFAKTSGGMAGAFARMGAGARAKAMGNAYTAVAHGPSAVYFNPGALPFGSHAEFSAATAHMALDRRLDFLAFSSPVHPPVKTGPGQKPVNAGVGVAWLHAGVSDIDSRDFDGNPLDMISQSSNLFMFSFAIQFHRRFGAGLTVKQVYETFGKIGNENRSINGDGFGADLGAFVRPLDHLSVGAQFKNLGTQTTWNTTDYWERGSSKQDQWPRQYRFGAAYERSGLIGAMDFEKDKDGETRLHLGAEGAVDVTPTQSVAGRLGYDHGALTFGIGHGFSFWKVRSVVDVTYAIEDVAPDNSATISFGVLF